MRTFALFGSLFFSSLCLADTNAERPNLDDPEVRKKIIEDAIEFEVVKKADGSFQFFEPLELSPYRGSGWGALYYINRNVKGLYQLKDGKKDGLFTSWHENGQKDGQHSWKDGKQDGLSTYWYENGQKRSEANFKEGKIDGLSTYWYENRQKRQQHSWKDGKQEGLSTYWYENGQKKEQDSWKDGKQDGLFTSWYENGQKRSEANLKDGKPDGLSTSWRENGQKRSEANYKNGKFDGLSTSWYENGQRKAVVLWSENKVVNCKVWLPDGRVCPISKVKDGSGVFVDYDIEGKEVYREKLKDGFKANVVNEKTKNPLDSSIPLPNLDEVAFPAIFPE
jgi:antitoxin component YwqK of YwqJK toxin-antitoxin module